MNFCFRSSSELQGEVDPTWQIAAFQTDLFWKLHQQPVYHSLQLWWSGSILPEVGDLQRSSEVLGPSLESQSAAGATKIWITIGINHSKLG